MEAIIWIVVFAVTFVLAIKLPGGIICNTLSGVCVFSFPVAVCEVFFFAPPLVLTIVMIAGEVIGLFLTIWTMRLLRLKDHARFDVTLGIISAWAGLFAFNYKDQVGMLIRVVMP